MDAVTPLYIHYSESRCLRAMKRKKRSCRDSTPAVFATNDVNEPSRAESSRVGSRGEVVTPVA